MYLGGLKKNRTRTTLKIVYLHYLFLIISASQSYNFIQIIFFLQPYNIIVTVETHKETWDQFLDVGISIPSLCLLGFFKAVQLFGLVCLYEND